MKDKRQPQRQPLDYAEVITDAVILLVGLGLIAASLYNVLNK